VFFAATLAASLHRPPDRLATSDGGDALSSTSALDDLLIRPEDPTGFGAASATRASTAGDVAIAPPPVEFDAPPAPPAPPPPALAQLSPQPDLKPGIWAVVVGINDYPGSRADLRSAVTDADDMDAALAKLGVAPDHRLVLHDREASADTLRRALDWLVLNAGPDATAVFSYAGHVRKLDRDTEAMVAADGRLVTDAEVATRLQGLAARHLWIVMETCYGGGFTEPLRAGRVLTAAADANSLAYENLGFGRSYLGEYLVYQGLIWAQARPNVQDAYAYAYASLARDYPNRLPFQDDRAGETVSLVAPGAHVDSGGSAASQSGGSGSGGSGSGGSSGPSTTTTTTRRSSGDGGGDPRPDGGGGGGGDDGGCVGLDLGVVDCD